MSSTERIIEILEHRGIRNPALLDAVHAIDRDVFMGGIDLDPSPEIIGRMIQALEVDYDDRILQIGAGSGYAAAVLSMLANEVWVTENDVDVAKQARRRLRDLKLQNINLLYGDTIGEYSRHAPYTGIMVLVGMGTLPRRLAQRLDVGGVMVAAVGRPGHQNLIRVRRPSETELDEENLGPVNDRLLLGDILVEMGVIDRAEVELAALEADVEGKRLGEALLDGHQVRETDIYRALSVQRARDMLRAEEAMEQLDVRLARALPRVFLNHHNLLPLRRERDTMWIATSNLDTDPKMLADSLGVKRVELMLMPPTDLQVVWSSIDRLDTDDDEDSHRRGMSMFDGHTISEIDRILRDAADREISHVHFDRHGHQVLVRMRINGRLEERDEPLTSKGFDSLLHVVKIRARMDPKLRRRPQTGVFQRRAGSHVLEIRATTYPSPEGEALVLHVQRQIQRVPVLDDFLVTEPFRVAFSALMSRERGLVLFAGHEDPVFAEALLVGLSWTSRDPSRKTAALFETELPIPPAVQQIVLKPEEGLDREHAIELALGLDVDVLYVGALRTREDFAFALDLVRAHGLLVFGTTADQDALGGLYYPITIGVPSGLVSTLVAGIIAEREVHIDEDRFTLASLLPVSGAMRRHLAMKEDLDTLRVTALRAGFRSLDYQTAVLRGDAVMTPQEMAANYPAPWGNR